MPNNMTGRELADLLTGPKLQKARKTCYFKEMSTSSGKKPKDFLGEGFEASQLEERVLDFWKANDISGKSLNLRKGGAPFVFYEGPPGANGRPGLHHVISRIFKDIICRYQTMRGRYVPRKSGWDTHGLPVEIAAEKALGLRNKKEIEEYGIAAFNEKCREIVWEYKNEWERFTERIGFWLDLKDPYVTYANDYVESLWWVIRQFAEKDLLYRGYRIVNWCTRCGTGLSSHELGQPGAYVEVIDQSVYVKFRLTPGQRIKNWETTRDTFILAWTTTPWTLPGNLALAVGEDIDYVLVRAKDKPKETYLLAKERLTALGMADGAHIVKGKDLVGLEYEPLFDISGLRSEASYRVYPADFVTTSDGTGVVHTAVMYGEDDFQLGRALGLPEKHTVAEDGRFTEEVPGLAGQYVKAKQTEEAIFEHLRKGGNLLKTESYAHEYPHCWRCQTPLLYYARNSWFVAVNKIRKQMLRNNETINWVPGHLKHGRFGEWLKEEKDWNFSRERYWGTPLPVWECEKCGEWEAIGSLKELSRRSTVQPRNRYWVMRHGQAENNLFNIVDSGSGNFHLTPKGKKQVKASVEELARELKRKGRKIDLIVASPVLRTQETAKMAEKILKPEALVTEPLFKEIQLPGFTGKPAAEYSAAYPALESRFRQTPPKGENLNMLRERMWQALQKLEKKYAGKNILIVSHEDPIWMLCQAAAGWSEEQTIREKEKRDYVFVDTGETRELGVKSLPRDGSGQLELHRPYVDQVEIRCAKCKGAARRVKEVVDVWYDSGAMPFAQWHYPFEHKKFIDAGERFPAEYICEAVDQTRGWFYTLLAVSTLLGKGAPFRNVISLGHINDKHGQKMSKSKGNVIDPWEIMSQYGIDAVRWYLYTATPPGEPKNFDAQEVLKALRRFQTILYNSYVYWRTYGQKASQKPVLKNPLDKWLMARLAETTEAVTGNLERYAIREACLAAEDLTNDLSRWYIRRSRRRFTAEAKGYGAGGDHKAASWVLEQVLREISKLIAPMTPFFGEALYQSMAAHSGGNPPAGGAQSVHLVDWPETEERGKGKGKEESKLLARMAEVRRLASLALAKRAEAGIRIRQPLQTLWIKEDKLGLSRDSGLLEILKDEVNVKEVAFNPRLTEETALDTKITPELRAEGVLRELTRSVQDLRQKTGAEPKDRICLMLSLPEELRIMIAARENELKMETGAKEVAYKRGDKFDAEAETKLEEKEVWIGVRKI